MRDTLPHFSGFFSRIEAQSSRKLSVCSGLKIVVAKPTLPTTRMVLVNNILLSPPFSAPLILKLLFSDSLLYYSFSSLLCAQFSSRNRALTVVRWALWAVQVNHSFQSPGVRISRSFTARFFFAAWLSVSAFRDPDFQQRCPSSPILFGLAVWA